MGFVRSEYVTHSDWSGIAFYIAEYYPLTNRAICIMVGDDRRWDFDAHDLTSIEEDGVCSCGQLGCHA